MVNAIRLSGVAVLLLAGCTSSSTPTADPSASAEQSPRLVQVTLYVARMNERLQILWGDWPNKVKQALAGLEGVEKVEDEWQREPQPEEDLDLLFVTYDSQRTTIDKMLKTIAEQEFEAKVAE